MKKISGAFTGKRNVLGRLTHQRLSLKHRRGAILVSEAPSWSDAGYAGIITTAPSASSFLGPPHFVVESLNGMPEGDVVMLGENHAHFLWEVGSRNNGLLLTESCNCCCLMCPQPPTGKAFDAKQARLASDVLALSPEGFDGEICLTGGEPTLCGDVLLDLLVACHQRHPKANLIMLTNGKRFSKFDFAKRFAHLSVPITVAVSLHADADTLHDKIVGAKGSFQMTQRGLYNLARFGQQIEIRVVVNKLNAMRLPQIARHIYRNYLFVSHVTFMGLEVTGHAVKNYDSIWIDPVEYGNSLETALHELHRAGMNVSTYNHPLCLLPKTAWPFARMSISAWKNDYAPECVRCTVREQCCGLFTTSGERVSDGIRPVLG